MTRNLIAATLATALLAGTFLLLGAGVYGWTLLVVLPVIAGASSVPIVRPQSTVAAAAAGAVTVMCATGMLLVLGLEGLICIAMALPLTMPLGAIGGIIAYHAGSAVTSKRGVAMFLFLPATTATYDAQTRPPVFAVRTAVEIAAPAEHVWNHVVTFSELPAPEEWYFKTGIAYPKRARILGDGPGAVRYCEFSTGAFVEPIDVWDRPRLLRFRVTENPAPMHEWSPYAQILPKHLHGYLVSRQGQFRLTATRGGGTVLEGTTWYQHGLWPAEYWRFWSDAIIHRIHMRVLNHIKRSSEEDTVAIAMGE